MKAEKQEDISPCNTALNNMREKITRGNREISVEFETRDISNSSDWYLDMPKDRPQELQVIISSNINNFMISTDPLKMTTLAIKDCKLVSVVTYGIYKTDHIASYGLVNGVVQSFECIEANRYRTRKIMWGQQSC